MDWLCGYDVAGLFAAGGTGEFFSLTPFEVAKVVAVAVDETKGRTPVLAGTGYGTAIAKEIAIAAERAGADGLLLLPPYLVHSEQEWPCSACRSRLRFDKARGDRLQPRQRNAERGHANATV
jgi:5-dehydro-4-deoxyglucarate dehydratase